MTKRAMLRVEKISKRFPGVLALNEVNFELLPGEVHMLLGENGAGKSTLLKILSGVYQADSGKIYIDEKEVRIPNPHTSQGLGISIIYQEFSLVKQMTIAENIFLGREKLKLPLFRTINNKDMIRESSEILSLISCAIDPRTRIKNLGVGQQQMVAIARALAVNARIIIMDEPTASLSHFEIRELFKIVNQLRAAGKSIIYVSHRLEEFEEIGDRATVLRDGVMVGTVAVKETKVDELITMMAGREVSSEYPWRKRDRGASVLEVSGLGKSGIFENVSFKLHKGEILGLFGIVGSGRTEMIQSVFGYLNYEQGVIKVQGEEIRPRKPSNAIQKEMGLLSEDRLSHGLIGIHSVKNNVTLASLWRVIKRFRLDLKKEKAITLELTDVLNIQPQDPSQKVIYLSGGNQQKVCLAKWLCSKADILFFDEPTKGIDVATKFEIHKLMIDLVREGKAILMISSELKEILGMSDRVLVMRRGTIVGEFEREVANSENVIRYAIMGNEDTVCQPIERLS